MKICEIKLMAFMFVFFISLFGCNSEKKESIKIGAILPLTGPAAQFGQNAKNGIQLAINKLNEKNKTNIIKVTFQDSQGNSKNAITTFNGLTETEKIDICFVLTSVETIALKPLINKEKIITFTGTLLPNVTTDSDYLFRNGISLDMEAKSMSNYLKDVKNSPTVGIIYINNDAGIVAKENFEREYVKFNGTVLTSQAYEPKATDFKTQLLKIREVDPDYLYILSYSEFGIIMKQARELGIISKFIGTSTFEDPTGVELAGGFAEGSEFTSPAFGSDNNDSIYNKFQEDYEKLYGRKSEVYGAIFFDNINIITNFFNSQKDFNNQSFLSYMKNVKDFDGASGRTSFLENRDVVKPIIIKRIKNKTFIKVNE